jgi:hypothetical protein
MERKTNEWKEKHTSSNTKIKTLNRQRKGIVDIKIGSFNFLFKNLDICV